MALIDRDYMREPRPQPELRVEPSTNTQESDAPGAGVVKVILLLVAATVIAAVIMSEVVNIHFVPDSGATNPIAAPAPPVAHINGPGAGWGVHVCKPKHYDARNVICTGIDVHIPLTQFRSTHLAYTGINGARFTNTTLTYQVLKADTSGYTILGSTTSAASLTFIAQSVTLADVFTASSVTPQRGSRYQLAVDEGNTPLGTADFIATR